MIIKLENQTIEYENKVEEIDNILNEVNEIIAKEGKILSHMIIDGLEIYEDYYNYFLDNIRVIEEVELISLTYRELVDDILISTLNYLERTPNIIESLANKFYKTPDMEAWNDLNDLLGGISWINNSFSTIDGDSKLKELVSSYEDWNFYAKEVLSLQEILPDLEEALSNGDNIKIADILSYEITEIFEQMAGKLLRMANMEARLNDLN